MKKLIIFLLLSITLYSASERISNIKSIYSEVTETVYLNNEKKEKRYTIEYIAPEYLRKEILFPNVNKGEIFQYENNETKIYIPLFDEVVVEKKRDDFGNFLSIIKNLKEKDKNDSKFRDSYYQKKVKELKYQNTYTARLKEYEIIDGFLLPVKIEIFERENKVAELILKNSKVNKNILKKELLK